MGHWTFEMGKINRSVVLSLQVVIMSCCDLIIVVDVHAFVQYIFLSNESSKFKVF